MVSPSSVPNPWYQISPSYDTAATGLEVEIVRLQNSVVDIQQYTGLRSKVKVVPCRVVRDLGCAGVDVRYGGRGGRRLLGGRVV